MEFVDTHVVRDPRRSHYVYKKVQVHGPEDGTTSTDKEMTIIWVGSISSGILPDRSTVKVRITELGQKRGSTTDISRSRFVPVGS